MKTNKRETTEPLFGMRVQWGGGGGEHGRGTRRGEWHAFTITRRSTQVPLHVKL
jgi:hypothetical protein